jgi:DNA-binding response OmpR family regulator
VELSLTSSDSASSDVAPPHVAVVAIASTPAVEVLVSELRRDAMRVDVGDLELLRSPPAAPVYLCVLGAQIGTMIAEQVVAWAQSSELRPGLIGLIEDGGSSEREALLAAGYDDVVAGPVSPRELSARVRAVHRRVHWKGVRHGRLRFGTLTLDVDGHALWVDGKTISLTLIELAVLRELMKARGRPLSRAELLDAAWGSGDLEVSERAVDNVILRIRRKLPRPDLIETVRSVGFRLAPR